MNVQTFQIRLEPAFLQADQDTLNGFLETIEVKKTAVELVNGKTDYWSVLIFYSRGAIPPSAISGSKISYTMGDLTEEETRIYESLKDWRYEKAKLMGIPSYIICSNAQLAAVAKTKPQTPEDLIKLKGFAGQKTAKYGEELIAMLNAVS